MFSNSVAPDNKIPAIHEIMTICQAWHTEDRLREKKSDTFYRNSMCLFKKNSYFCNLIRKQSDVLINKGTEVPGQRGPPSPSVTGEDMRK